MPKKIKKKQTVPASRRCPTCHIRHHDAPWTLPNTNLPRFYNKCFYALSRSDEADRVARCRSGQIDPPVPCRACALGIGGQQRCPEFMNQRQDPNGNCPQRNWESFTRRSSLDPYPNR